VPVDLPEINPFSPLKNTVDICRQFVKLTALVMKCETTNTILTWVLGALVLLGALFALQAIFRARELRTLQTQVIACQSNMNRLNLLLTEGLQYGKTHPDINRVLQPFEAKSAAH
jgi:hypothetical protein